MNLLKIKIFILLCFMPIIMVAQSIDPYKNIKYFELENGLKVYILADKKAINTNIEVEVNVGIDVETKDTAGITHLLEHLVFRDSRIPYRDYLDYIKEEGATYVNGYTRTYTSGYLATIDSKKSYWLVETFAQMLFDKQVDISDLEIEKKALQVEIGEYQWYHPLTHVLGSVFKSIGKIFPDLENIYTTEFDLNKTKEQPSTYYAKRNNKDFSLKEVLEHYDTYYYPKNMVLKIVGNFDSIKMQDLIQQHFGMITRTGHKTAKEPKYTAKLNHKPHYSYVTGEWDKDYAYIGSKYILDDYKKYLVINAYTEHLARNMQQLLRNKLGQTYSVSSFYSSSQNAVLTGVDFSSLHNKFEESIELVKAKIHTDALHMNDTDIKSALKQSELYYSAIEHDSDTLLELLDTLKYLHDYHQIYNKTPYEIFAAISTEDFRSTIQETFSEENTYLYIYNDYYFFPYDLTILTFIMLFIMFYVYQKSYKYLYKKEGIKLYTKRDILWRRRLTTPFIVFIKFVIIFIFALSLSQWSEYYFFKIFMNNPYYINTITQPLNYLIQIISFVWYITIFMLINRYIFSRSYSRIDMTENAINCVGSTWHEIKEDTIKSIDIVPWSRQNMKKIFGSSLLFLKPLVKIETHNAKSIYLRSNNAQHLKEDLDKWRK